jgi:N-acetyl-anhydromuramyl-L-alanine amidase AmpD
MAKHRVRVGLHARNDKHFPEPDYSLVRTARIETLKMMSFTDVGVYQRLRRENPKIEFVVRLYDDRIHRNSRPSPKDFVAKMLPAIKRLKPYATKFEIHNEPNHADGIEGWGASNESARAFRSWYMQVIQSLKKAHPWARFGFPGLALNHPHRDLEWLDICRDAIQASDWLGCHCYWQYGNMSNSGWGQRFKLYNERFPTKRIEITEFGNSTPGLPAEQIGTQYAQYYQELNKYPYLGSASAFIASSPDPVWAPFVWRGEGGEMLPVVDAVRDMPRTAATVAAWPPKPKPEPPPEPPAIPERKVLQTGKTVRGNFLEFYDQYGTDICGYPITEQIEEGGNPAQYFQRVGLEETASGKIRLMLVGTLAWTSKAKIARMEAQIKELRARLSGVGSVKPRTEDIVERLPVHATKRYSRRPLADIKLIVIHHTATGPTTTPRSMAQYQVSKLDKPGITHHFFVAADGTIYETNRLETITDHASGRSQESVGVIFAGNFTNDIPTVAQLQAGAWLCAWLLDEYDLSTDAIMGLSEFVSTQSPGLQWLRGQRWKEVLLAGVEATLGIDGGDPSGLIDSLQARIAALQQEIAELKQALPAPNPGISEISRPAIEDVIGNLPRHQTKKYGSRSRSAIDSIVIHHSGVPSSVGPERIADYHVRSRGWPGIGYHFLVAADGTLYQVNAVETVSYHTAGMNTPSLGICFLGDFDTGAPPLAQLQAGAHLVAWLMQELGVELDLVKGHRELMDVSCPGSQWLEGKAWRQMLRRQVAEVQEEVTRAAAGTAPDDKPIYHYVLFWAHNGKWAKEEWLGAQGYIRTFRPTAGFSASDAVQAEHVTIIGGLHGVSEVVENWLRANGCKVDRIAGESDADTKRMLDELAKKGRRFRTSAK